MSRRKSNAAEPEGNALVIPNEGFYINGLPHVAQYAAPDVAERYVNSGAFHYGTADEAETEPLEPQEIPPHFAAPEPEAAETAESDESPNDAPPASPEPSQNDSPPPAE